MSSSPYAARLIRAASPPEPVRCSRAAGRCAAAIGQLLITVSTWAAISSIGANQTSPRDRSSSRNWCRHASAPDGRWQRDARPAPTARHRHRSPRILRQRPPALFGRADRHHVIQIHRLHILRPVIQPPMRRQLDQRPGGAFQQIGLIIAHQRGVIGKAACRQQVARAVREVVERRTPAARALAGCPDDDFDAAIQPMCLIVVAQLAGMFVQIAVMGDLVAAFQDRFDRLRDSFRCTRPG